MFGRVQHVSASVDLSRCLNLGASINDQQIGGAPHPVQTIIIRVDTISFVSDKTRRATFSQIADLGDYIIWDVFDIGTKMKPYIDRLCPDRVHWDLFHGLSSLLKI